MASPGARTPDRATVRGGPRGPAYWSWLALSATLCLAAVGLAVGLPTSTTGQSSIADPAAPIGPADLEAACTTGNPYLAAVCYPYEVAAQSARIASVEVFRRTPAGSPHYAVAYEAQVGAVYGLAYSKRDGALYAAAFHKRQTRFGPDGAGAIYRIEVETGQTSLFARVPDPGDDHHTAEDIDAQARDWVGATSLGDLDLDEAAGDLFVVNLNDRRIYRYALATGALMAAFPHGAAGEDWAADARPFGLAVHGERLYHGVVNSAQSTQDVSQLAAFVYESLADGSQMRRVASVALDYDRGVARLPTHPFGVAEVTPPLDWRPWRDGENSLADAIASVYPMPILADLAFDGRGNMVLGFRDRHGDMTALWPWTEITGEAPGLGLGDVLYASRSADTWQVHSVPEPYYDRTNLADESVLGGLAHLALPDITVAASVSALRREQGSAQSGVGADWFAFDAARGSGDRLFHERLCVFGGTEPVLAGLVGRPAAPQDNEGLVHGLTVGDVEVLCHPPSPTATPKPSPMPSITATPSPTAIPTPSPTPTPSRWTIRLPVVADACDPRTRHTDVVLVIDASSSMQDRTAAGRPKIEAARDAARLFLKQLALPEDQAAVIAFNDRATRIQALTGDLQALESALDRIEIRQYTRIDLGIAMALEEITGPMHRPANTPAMIILSDGHNNPEPVSTAIQRASEAKAADVRLFTIGLGDGADLSSLREMASRPTDFFFAPDGEDLAGIYRRIAGEAPCPPGTMWPVAAPGSSRLLSPSAAADPVPGSEVARLVPVGEVGGLVRAVDAAGQWAYIGLDDRLVVLDLTDPAHPTEVGRTGRLAGHVTDIRVRDGTAFVTVGPGGLAEVDVSDPAHPRPLGRADTAGEALAVVLDGDHAYVAVGPGGLYVIDVASPGQPRPIGQLDVHGSVRDVALAHGYAYVVSSTAWEQSVVVVDVSDPAQPTELASYDTPGGAESVGANADYVMVMGNRVQPYVYSRLAGGGLQLEITYFGAPLEHSAFGELLVDGPFTFGSPGGDRLFVHKLLGAEPVGYPTIRAKGTIVGLAKVGDLLLVACLDGGLRIFDISRLATAVLTGAYLTPGQAQSVLVAGGAAYVGDSQSGAHAVDVSDPAAPRMAGLLDTGHGAYDIALGPHGALDGPLLTVVGEATVPHVNRVNGGLWVAATSDPFTPTLMGVLLEEGRRPPEPIVRMRAFAIRALALGDTQAYAVSRNHSPGFRFGDFWVVDVTAPEDPTMVGLLSRPDTDPWDVILKDDRAYVADRYSGLWVVDVGNPAVPALVGELATPGEATGLAIADDRLYVAAGSAGLLVYGLADPDAPQPIGQLDTPGDARRVAIVGDRAYVADGAGGVRLVNVATPASPREIAHHAPAGDITDVAVKGDLVYATARQGRLLVLRLVLATATPTDTAVPSTPTSTTTPTPESPGAIFLPSTHRDDG